MAAEHASSPSILSLSARTGWTSASVHGADLPYANVNTRHPEPPQGTAGSDPPPSLAKLETRENLLIVQMLENASLGGREWCLNGDLSALDEAVRDSAAGKEGGCRSPVGDGGGGDCGGVAAPDAALILNPLGEAAPATQQPQHVPVRKLQRREKFEHESDHDSCPFLAIRKSQWFVEFLDSIHRTSPIDADRILASFSIKNDFMFYPPRKTYRFLRDAETGAITVGESADMNNPDEGESRLRREENTFLRTPLRRRADYEARPELDSRKQIGARHGISGLGTFMTPSDRKPRFEMVFIPWEGEVQSYRIEKDEVILETKVWVGGPLFAFSLGCPIPCSIIRPNGKMSSHIAIFFHCNGEDVGHSSCMRLQTLANALHVTVVVPEYPGYGLFRGSPSEASVKAAMERVVQFLLCVDGTLMPSRLLLIGHSIGTAVAVHIAAHIHEVFERMQAHYEGDVACPAAYTNELAQHGKPTFFEAFQRNTSVRSTGASPSAGAGMGGGAVPPASLADNDDSDNGVTARHGAVEQRRCVAQGIARPHTNKHTRVESMNFSPVAGGGPVRESGSSHHEPFADNEAGAEAPAQLHHSDPLMSNRSSGGARPNAAAGYDGEDEETDRDAEDCDAGDDGASSTTASEESPKGCWGRRCPRLGCLPCRVGGGRGADRRYFPSAVTHCWHNALGGIILISSFTALRCVEYVPTFKKTYRLHPTQLEVRRRQVPCDTVYPAPVDWAADALERVPPEQIHFDMEEMTTPCLFKASRFLSFNRFPTVDVMCRLQETYRYFAHTPLLLVHGTDDELISPIHSVAIASKLRQCRRGGSTARVFLSLLTGGGHNDLPCIREIRRFYKDQVLLPHLERQERLRQRLADLYQSGRDQLSGTAADGARSPRGERVRAEGSARNNQASAHSESRAVVPPPPMELYFLSHDPTLTREPSTHLMGPGSPAEPPNHNHQQSQPPDDAGTPPLAFAFFTRANPASTTTSIEDGDSSLGGHHGHHSHQHHYEQSPSRSRSVGFVRDREIYGPFIHREASMLSEPDHPNAVVKNTSLLHTLEQTRSTAGGDQGSFAPAATILHMSMYPRLERYDVGSVLVASMRANALPKEEAYRMYQRHHRLAWMWRMLVALLFLLTSMAVLAIGTTHAVLCRPGRLQGYMPIGHTASEYSRDNRVLAWAVLESSMMAIAFVLRVLQPYYGLSSVSKERDRHSHAAFQMFSTLTLTVFVLVTGIGILMGFILALTPHTRGGVNWGKWSSLPYSRKVWISFLPRWFMVGVASCHCVVMLFIIVKNH